MHSVISNNFCISCLLVIIDIRWYIDTLKTASLKKLVHEILNEV